MKWYPEPPLLTRSAVILPGMLSCKKFQGHHPGGSPVRSNPGKKGWQGALPEHTEHTAWSGAGETVSAPGRASGAAVRGAVPSAEWVTPGADTEWPRDPSPWAQCFKRAGHREEGTQGTSSPAGSRPQAYERRSWALPCAQLRELWRQLGPSWSPREPPDSAPSVAFAAPPQGTWTSCQGRALSSRGCPWRANGIIGPSRLGPAQGCPWGANTSESAQSRLFLTIILC